jgi:hypothetical protein
MTGYSATFEAPDGATATVGPDAIVAPDVPDEHSVINEWRFEIRPDEPALEAFRHGSVALYFEADDGSQRLIQAGPVDAITSSPTDGRTTVRAKDDLQRLRRGGPTDGTIIADGEAAAEIERVWGLTPFDADVTAPDPQPVSEGREIQGGDLTTVFSSLPETAPVVVSSGEVRPAQTAWVAEAGTRVDADRFSGGTAEFFNSVGDFSDSLTFTPQYRVPNDHLRFAFRGEKDDGGLLLAFQLSGSGQVTSGTTPTSTLGWTDQAPSQFSGDLAADTQHTVFLESINDFSSDDEFPDATVDLIAVYDDRYPPTFDNQVHEPGGYLDGPEAIPASVQAVADAVETANSITAAELAVAADTATNQSLGIEFGPDTSTAFDADLTGTNTTTLSGENPGDLEATIQAAVTLGRTDATRDTQTPRTGFEAQTLTDWSLAVDEVSILTFNNREFSGNWYQILQEMHADGGLIFRNVPTAGDSYQAESFAKGALAGAPIDWTRLGYERGYESTTEYANRLYAVGGEPDDGSPRPTTTVEDSDEIDRVGGAIETYRTFDSQTTENDLINRAQAELRSLTEDQLGGTVEIVPRRLEVGKRYSVPAFDGAEVVLERLRFSDGAEPSGSLEFSQRQDVPTAIANVRREVRREER